MLVPYLQCFTPDGKLDPNKEYEPTDTKGRKVDAGRLPAGHGCGEAPAACPFSCTLEPSTQISADAT